MTRHVLFLFVDGVGLGADDAEINPFAAASLPTLTRLSNGQRWLKSTGLQISERAVFVPTDACLGVPGRPQSGSSQAAILTGFNIPELIGEHYGPKPNEPIRHILDHDNLFIRLKRAGRKCLLLDAYPESLLHNIRRGKTLPSSIQYAAIASGQSLLTADDLRAGRALTAEWTGEEWHSYMKYTDTPIYTPHEAGTKLVELSREQDFAFHSHWMTDYVGHRGDLADGVKLLERLDGVISGILDGWDDNEGLVILTSDHGNMEVIGDRHHTENKVPTLVIGHDAPAFCDGLHDLTDLAPRIEQYLK